MQQRNWCNLHILKLIISFGRSSVMRELYLVPHESQSLVKEGLMHMIFFLKVMTFSLKVLDKKCPVHKKWQKLLSSNYEKQISFLKRNFRNLFRLNFWMFSILVTGGKIFFHVVFLKKKILSTEGVVENCFVSLEKQHS